MVIGLLSQLGHFPPPLKCGAVVVDEETTLALPAAAAAVQLEQYLLLVQQLICCPSAKVVNTETRPQRRLMEAVPVREALKMLAAALDIQAFSATQRLRATLF